MRNELIRRNRSSVYPACIAAIIIVCLQLPIAGDFRPIGGSAAYAQGSGDVAVADMVLCKGIFNKEPVGPTTEVSLSEGRIYTWTKIKALSPPTFVKHIYYHQGKKVAEVDLDIKYPTFRTWSYKTLQGDWMLGEWQVKVYSAEGKLLASEDFTVTE